MMNTKVGKHFTLNKSIEVGDHRLSATPEEMRQIIEDTTTIYEISTKTRLAQFLTGDITTGGCGHDAGSS